MHGSESGEVVPTTTLVLGHDHPDDRDQVNRLLREELLGYVVDVTDAVAARAHERAFRDIQAAAEGRGAIEQAEGVLIATYGVDEDEAFRRLRRASNDKNVRLRDLAHLVVGEATRAGSDCSRQVDALLH
ncbi:MAG: hypothetical protein K0S43_725 [Cellulosimicrobium sp.]|nr:hypothetical protein [Cellulosimicrobium sp.]